MRPSISGFPGQAAVGRDGERHADAVYHRRLLCAEGQQRRRHACQMRECATVRQWWYGGRVAATLDDRVLGAASCFTTRGRQLAPT